LEASEFVSQVRITGWALQTKWAHVKKTAREKIAYPLVNVSALVKEGRLRAAFSGLCPFPFRSEEIEHVLNDRKTSVQSRADAIPGLLPENAWTNSEASGEYRLFVLKNTVHHLLEDWENGDILQ
jgi:CO/xanthine dehydrogenase FAD-binding subunit